MEMKGADKSYIKLRQGVTGKTLVNSTSIAQKELKYVKQSNF